MKNDKTIKGERTVYFDYLRVAATLAVMVIHIAARNWGRVEVGTYEWQVFNWADSLVRWSVPVFVMISGALFLSRDIPVRKLYSKYVLRMTTSFLVWSILYAAIADVSTTERIERIITGNYHMWFILMITGLYICTPVIKAITSDETRMKYYLVLSGIFAFAVPWLVCLVNDFAGGGHFAKGVAAIYADIGVMNLSILMGYPAYYVLGYYLSRTELSVGVRRAIYLAGIAGFVLTGALTAAVSLRSGVALENYYGYFSVNILLMAAAVFTWFKYNMNKAGRYAPLMAKLAGYSYGAYLVHALVIKELRKQFGLTTMSFQPVAALLLITAIVFVVSFAVSAVLNHIPVVKKYCV